MIAVVVLAALVVCDAATIGLYVFFDDLQRKGRTAVVIAGVDEVQVLAVGDLTT